MLYLGNSFACRTQLGWSFSGIAAVTAWLLEFVRAVEAVSYTKRNGNDSATTFELDAFVASQPHPPSESSSAGTRTLGGGRWL